MSEEWNSWVKSVLGNLIKSDKHINNILDI